MQRFHPVKSRSLGILAGSVVICYMRKYQEVRMTIGI